MQVADAGAERLRTLIVDDEQRARELMRRELAAIEGAEVVGEAGDGETAVRRIRELRPDLVLLDIQMPERNGFDVLRGIDGPLPAIVFVTAYSEHAIKAFEVGAVDYLLKPFGTDRLRMAVERARAGRGNPGAEAEKVAGALNAEAARARRKPKVVASHGKDYLLLDLDSVYAFRAAGDQVRVLTRAGRYFATQTLGELERKLAEWGFLRVHRSVLVNGDKIARISSLSNRRWLLTLNNSYQCVVSKRNSAIVRALLG